MMNQTPHLLCRCFMVMSSIAIGTTQTAVVVPPTVMPSVVAGLSIETSSKEVTPSITKHLSVNCTFSKSDNQQVTSLISLILARWDRPSESMQEILTITSFDLLQVTELQQVRGKVDGALESNGDAFLSIVWDYPSEFEATKYTCEFHAFDKVGHPLEAKVGVEVKASDIDISKVAEKVRSLAEWSLSQIMLNSNVNMSQEFQNNVLNQLERINAAQNVTIDSLKNNLKRQNLVNAAQNLTISNLTNTVDRQKLVNTAQNLTIETLTSSLEQKEKVNAAQNHTIDVLTNTLDRQEKIIASQNITLRRLKDWVGYDTTFKDATIQTSSVVIDLQRLFWTNENMNFTQAQTLCRSEGGKLAELSYEKLKAVASQLQADGLSSWYYWIGLRRDDVNSDWVWASDGRDAGSVTWYGIPSSTKHCATFYTEVPGYYEYPCSNHFMNVLCSRYMFTRT